MRTKQMFQGLNNTQKIRFFMDGVGMFCKVQDVENICTAKHRVALSSALNHIGYTNWSAKVMNKPGITGFASTFHGVDVQVDLI